MPTLLLDERLEALAELSAQACPAHGASLVADIGADHGRLACALLQRLPGLRMIVSDVSADSLDKARRLLAAEGLAERAVLRVADGLAALAGERPDAVVVAGMGAKTIREIVLAGAQAIGDARLILQPNLDAPRLRAFLCAHGFPLEAERIVRAAGRSYVILCARRGACVTLDAKACAIGPCLMAERPPGYAKYLRWRHGVASRVLARLADAHDGQRQGVAARRASLLQEICWLEEELAP